MNQLEYQLDFPQNGTFFNKLHMSKALAVAQQGGALLDLFASSDLVLLNRDELERWIDPLLCTAQVDQLLLAAFDRQKHGIEAHVHELMVNRKLYTRIMCGKSKAAEDRIVGVLAGLQERLANRGVFIKKRFEILRDW
jgi:hypothetical protein